MATTDTKVNQLVLNILTKSQYDSLSSVDDNQLYFITDDNKIVVHHITIEGTANNYPFALCFTIRCPYEKSSSNAITSVSELTSLINLYSYQDCCTGYYISFNVDVMSIGVNGLKYYQNSAISTLAWSTLASGISSVSDTLQTMDL